MNLTTLTIPLMTAGLVLGGLQQQALSQGVSGDGATANEPAPVTARQELHSKLVVDYYTPKKAPVQDLVFAMTRLFENKNRGSLNVFSFQEFGQTLLMQCSEAAMPEAVKLVRQMDEHYVGVNEHTATTEEQYLYKLRYASLESVREALNAMDQRMIQSTSRVRIGLNIGYIEARGMVLVRGPSVLVSKAKEILKELDVPPPSLMITCYLVQGKAGESSFGIPAELAADLSTLVPYEGFELLSSGMLPSNAASRLQLEVELDHGKGDFRLEMAPSAYDESRGLLSMSSIVFRTNLFSDSPTADKPERTKRSFSTSTSLATDKYTVLGAVGADPVFVVVRMTQLKN
jgi:hypothetical protein